MKILIACEYSGRVRDAFIAKGHDAISADLLPTEKPGPHYQGDVQDILYEHWDMIIAFPPCTYLSKAGARWMFAGNELNNDRYEKALKAKVFFMKFYNHPCEKICIENTLQMKIMKMPKHTQYIQPYMFGEPYSKKTVLWLKGLPALQPTQIICEFTPWVQSSKHRGEYQPPTKNAKDRALTFQGFANAMADQWS
jgi:hypothetical protein